MLIPRYWARADGTATGRDGRTLRLRCWGVSADSQADAAADAERRLDGLLRRTRDGHVPGAGYPYRRSVVREQLVHEIAGTDSGAMAMVTRNRYGALVVNAAAALFVDVDLPRDTLSRRLLALLRGKAAPLDQRVLDSLCAALARRSNEGFRVYRTAAGFRVLGVSRGYDPGDDGTRQWMRSLGCDRAFVDLCRVQRCFRARLTPKPWRIGVPTPTWLFPFETPAAAAAYDVWSQGYERACAGWAACALAASVGPEGVHPAVQPVLDLHDATARVGTGLPLA